ncbi:hypothetical protein SiRe_1102 [Sulfolobus islandicus REY15A]|uniref:Uncharacterized protein n=1 Tax=Saccharolobus islandicus (strain REY15A) TaxID=930945 RepID=F0NHE8_SACI5|nr:hypothetical protein SiRe_1102 [Sulfolobus islandicus REY15A]
MVVCFWEGHAYVSYSLPLRGWLGLFSISLGLSIFLLYIR